MTIAGAMGPPPGAEIRDPFDRPHAIGTGTPIRAPAGHDRRDPSVPVGLARMV